MKGDFTQDTFKADKHYQQVLMQQGRAQLDADWNEQAALAARRDATDMTDLIGRCGGPADNAAFAIAMAVAQLPPQQKADWFDKLTPAEQATINAKLAAGGDFLLTAGRYYVDGLQCELEHPVLFSAQPDRFTVETLASSKNYLLFLDVWLRHITAVEDGGIREPALGGPDTATRVKTVWQVRALEMKTPDPASPCTTPVSAFNDLLVPPSARLTADTAKAKATDDPCEVPESAGYKGLENQLYRVEIHQGSKGIDGKPTTPAWKWSRENGSVVTPIMRIDGDTITVSSLGPAERLGFRTGDWVEILDDALELENEPSQLLQVADFNPAQRMLRLKATANPLVPPAQFPDGVDPARHPKLRRWEGTDTVVAKKVSPLESGVQISFDNAAAEYHTGEYWQIPARAATATAPAGDIEWPRQNPADPTTPRLSLLPRGVAHHYCRLGIVSVDATGVKLVSDCRCLWPALSRLRLFHVSGDGQEVMPDLTRAGALFKLPKPLVVGVANLHANSKVRFTITAGDGKIEGDGKSATGINTFIDVDAMPTANGHAGCDFFLDGVNYSQQVTARLLDADCGGVPQSIVFNANLSIASQVAYDPRTCRALSGQTTVQAAVDRLVDQISLYKLSGDAQTVRPGETLKPLRLYAANRCGRVELDRKAIKFTLLPDGNPAQGTANKVDDTVEFQWDLPAAQGTYELKAELKSDFSSPAAEPKSVVFTAQRVAAPTQHDKGIHVLGVLVQGNRLLNDSEVRPNQLVDGFTVLLDQAADTLAVNGKPTCFITVEVPYPLLSAEREFWKVGDREFPVFQPLVLRTKIHTKDGQILFLFEPRVIDWMDLLLNHSARVVGLSRILARLTLKGNVIWKAGEPRTNLDGEAFGRTRDGRLDLDLDNGSGDGRRGGDFEMWFWLTNQAANPAIPDAASPVETRVPGPISSRGRAKKDR